MRPTMNDRVGIAVFAKAPIEGLAKTRLIPYLGASGAADLQRAMIEDTLAKALTSNVGPVCAPDCRHELFAVLAANYGIELHSQAGADLGSRMFNAFDILTPRYPVILIGTDCPVLTPLNLIESANLLREGRDVVFLPTEDGGYALIGAAKAWPEIFVDIRWGTDGVMAETRLRASALGLLTAEPAIVWDIDTPADYDRAAASGLLDFTCARRLPSIAPDADRDKFHEVGHDKP
jgi:rSAM/selenodomain-associated transferase 1